MKIADKSLPEYKWRLMYGTNVTGDRTEPWLTREAITFLDAYLKKDMVAVEFGSGLSTAWTAKRVGKLYTVEHDPFWHGELLESLKQEQTTNVEVIYIEGDVTYMKAEELLKDVQADYVLVDGTLDSRVPMAIFGYSILKSGGIIVLDDSETREYQPAVKFLTERCGPPTGNPPILVKGITSWWRKP